MIIAEYTIDHVILRETLRRASSTEVEWEESHTGPDGTRQFVAWVESDDFDAFDRGVRDDPSVTDPEVLTDTGSRRLYRFTLQGEALETDLMPLLMEVGGVHRELVATADGWLNRTRFPNRRAFERVHRFCEDYGMAFTFHRIWVESDRYGGSPGAMTEAQRETLLAAIDAGYLDVPRDCTLAELGDRLGISESAASERFRRATKGLIRQTLQ